MTDADEQDDRAELHAIAVALRGYVEWHDLTGSTGFPREARVQAAPQPVPEAPPSAPRVVQAPPHQPAFNPEQMMADAMAEEPTVVAEAKAEAAAVIAKPAPRALDVIAQEVASCMRCDLGSTRQHTVFARGNPQAALCFVGEAPGADEDASGIPFVGAAGQLLDKMIAAMGLDVERDVYVCNIIKCRPPGNRRPTPEETDACRPYFEEQLAMVSPRVIVALGNTAVAALLGTTLGITKLRGQWKLYQGQHAAHAHVPPVVLAAAVAHAGTKQARGLERSADRDERAGTHGPLISAVEFDLRRHGSRALLRPSYGRRRISMPFLSTSDGTQLFWREWGEGQPVLFLSSLGTSTQLWDYQLAHFAARGFRCIALDRRGHGRSDEAPRGYDMDTLASDVAALIEHLDLADLAVVTHSFGAGEIVRFVSRYGSARLACIVMVVPMTPALLQTASNPHGAPAAGFEALFAQWTHDYPKWAEDSLAPFFVPETSPSMQRWGLTLLQTSVPVALACARTMVAADFRAELQALTVPTLVVHGDRDQSAPIDLTGRRTAALVPRSQLAVYEGAPHGVMFTHRERLHADIERFVRESA